MLTTTSKQSEETVSSVEAAWPLLTQAFLLFFGFLLYWL
jgi:hypothetical protein